VIENVVLDEANRLVDFADARITENTRGAYPIEFNRNARIPASPGTRSR
jgi:phosphoenolpyruvate carboxykinase (ATP)